mmetsp:Transcript_30689/g.99827  ORF Transcript_30689/g.99827 Transcript_30689/m.99827 type:complete len:222 (-) Transcript_30689:684-1349(-)
MVAPERRSSVFLHRQRSGRLSLRVSHGIDVGERASSARSRHLCRAPLLGGEYPFQGPRILFARAGARGLRRAAPPRAQGVPGLSGRRHDCVRRLVRRDAQRVDAHQVPAPHPRLHRGVGAYPRLPWARAQIRGRGVLAGGDAGRDAGGGRQGGLRRGTPRRVAHPLQLGRGRGWPREPRAGVRDVPGAAERGRSGAPRALARGGVRFHEHGFLSLRLELHD